MKWDFTMTQHIFLTGKKHIGKSTLTQKILDDYKKTADGFLTVRTKDYLKNQYSVHMYHLKEKEFPNESNLLFLCGKTDEHTADTFDLLGCNILSMCSDCSLIVMDELGPHEADATLFRKKILNLLDGQTPILGVLQEPAESFWPEIVNHPKVEIITSETLQSVYDIEMDVITTHDRYGHERTICLPVNSSAKTVHEK